MDKRICACILQIISELKLETVAGYQAVNGEPDISPALRELQQLGHPVCLPVIHPLGEGEMEFRRWSHNCELKSNRFGILEPAGTATAPLSEIGLVLTPLVAYSTDGHRIGMGGGYYDRIFAAPAANSAMLRCGVAYALQEVPPGNPDPWDIALHAVINEHGWFTFKR